MVYFSGNMFGRHLSLKVRQVIGSVREILIVEKLMLKTGAEEESNIMANTFLSMKLWMVQFCNLAP